MGALPAAAWKAAGSGYEFQRIIVPILGLNDDKLMKVSKEGQLALPLHHRDSGSRDRRKGSVGVHAHLARPTTRREARAGANLRLRLIGQSGQVSHGRHA
jgi:hypothetical protein